MENKSEQSEDGISVVESRISSNARVLDVGCGSGKWGDLLKDKVCCVDGVEIWSPYIEKYKLKTIYRNVYNANIYTFCFETDTYDVVILGDVLEHLKYEQALSLISKLKKLVKEIYLIIPISVYIQGMVDNNPYEEHCYQWSNKEIQETLGFSLLHVGGIASAEIGTYVWEQQ